MKILLTGGTGFLGKRVLELLISDPSIEKILVVSRKKKTHPSSKVEMHELDLAEPLNLPELVHSVDTIIHLSGLYDFKKAYGANYHQNVLPTLNLIDAIRGIQRKRSKIPQVFFSSTYAVGIGQKELGELPLQAIPEVYHYYAFTKAIAERALTDSEVPSRIFRLGVLVGDSKSGQIEKIDGPYYLMKLLSSINEQRFARKAAEFLGKLPVPYQEGILPLVPVDQAAAVFHQALSFKRLNHSQSVIYGVYHPESISSSSFASRMFSEYFEKCRPKKLKLKIPSWAQSFQSRVTGIPPELFEFSLSPMKLSNPNFKRDFADHPISHFDTYQRPFFEGFQKWNHLQ